MSKIQKIRMLGTLIGVGMCFSLMMVPSAFSVDIGDVHTLSHDGRTRKFFIYVPSTYDGSVAVPLMIDAHALTADPQRQANSTDYDVMAEQDNFIVVYPQGLGFIKSWNGGDGGTEYDGCCGYALRNDIDDVGFMLAIVDWMETHYNIDSSRVYGSGLSNGSALMQKAIIEHADVFAAIYVAAQFLLELPAPIPSRPIPIMLSHGMDDTIAHYFGDGKFPSAQENFARWASINGCSGSPTIYYQKNGSFCEVYDSCDGNVEVRLCSIDDGHVHYSNDDDVPVAQMGWDFVKNYSQP